MSLAVAPIFPSSSAVLLNAAQVMPVALTMSTPKASLNIAIPALGLNISTSISKASKQMSANALSGFVIEAPLYGDANLIVNLNGNLVEEDDFRIQEVSINIDFSIESAEADFVTATFLASIGLADHVRLYIPEAELDLGLQFRSSPAEISRMLQRRQLSHRVMVVEGATSYKFDLPSDVSGGDVENLAFIYYAITRRSFVFPFTFITYPAIPATRENLELFTNINNQSFIVVGPEPISKSFLGKSISLGDDGTFIILNAQIDDFERVRTELARDDGHPVEVMIRSLSGRAQYNLPSAPQVSEATWEPFIQKLIDLDEDLDARLAERYHALAAATLTDFSDEEKEIAIRCPNLEIDVNLPALN